MESYHSWKTRVGSLAQVNANEELARLYTPYGIRVRAFRSRIALECCTAWRAHGAMWNLRAVIDRNCVIEKKLPLFK